VFPSSIRLVFRADAKVMQMSRTERLHGPSSHYNYHFTPSLKAADSCPHRHRKIPSYYEDDELYYSSTREISTSKVLYQSNNNNWGPVMQLRSQESTVQ